jgi:5-methylcytosine-specific restriction endonuclease McrA
MLTMGTHGEGSISRRKSDGLYQVSMTMPGGKRVYRYARTAKAAEKVRNPAALRDQVLHDSTGERWYIEAECDDGVTRWFMARDKPQRAARPPMPVDLRFRILERDGFRCRYCGRGTPEVTLHVDHVQSVADGGTDDESNLVASCRDCNLGKGRRSLPPP